MKMNSRVQGFLVSTVLGVFAAGWSPVLFAAGEDVIPVELVEHDGGWKLLRGGEPYEVRGAGLEYSDLSVFASHGGNSIRTWNRR